MNFLNRLYIDMQTKRLAREEARKNEQSLVKDERGVSAIVATVLLILFVALLAVLFWNQIKEWFDAMMDKIFNQTMDPESFG